MHVHVDPLTEEAPLPTQARASCPNPTADDQGNIKPKLCWLCGVFASKFDIIWSRNLQQRCQQDAEKLWIHFCKWLLTGMTQALAAFSWPIH